MAGAGDLFARLVASAGEAWQDYTRHEFVLRLARGELPLSCFRRYLIQDYLFLRHFARAFGLAVYKSQTLAEMRRASRILTATLEVEMGLHVETCRGWGISEQSLEASTEAPETIAYTRFVLDRGQSGDLLDLETVLAPCIEGYAVIARERMADPSTRREGNPYREWLEIYSGNEYQSLAAEMRAELDRLFGERAGEGRYPGLAADFTAAARLEAAFWQMGLDAAP